MSISDILYNLQTPTKLELGKLYYLEKFFKIKCKNFRKLYSYLWPSAGDTNMLSRPLLYIKFHECNFCKTNKNINAGWKTCDCKLDFLVKDVIFTFNKVYLPMLSTSGTRTFPTPKHTTFQHELIKQLKEITHV